LDRIFAKLGVHNRTEAALIYARHQGARGREGSGH
jgi:DNA-binding NarL/FixJ family response regulator